jgi:LytS/YehU family sensor histidine kinase
LLVFPLTASKRRYLLFILSSIGIIIVYAFLKYLVAYHFRDYYLAVGPDQREIPKQLIPYTVSTILPSGLMIFFSTVYKVMADWFKNEHIQNELKFQKTQAELQFLKSQINPHFLFNSLNNIYALAYKKSDETPEAILKLSEIMRYMLKESEDYKVDLKDEIKYLESYIDLHKLRYKDDIQFTARISIDQENYRVMPLLLISFIENIFKHGDVINPKNPVSIVLEVNKGLLKFNTVNTIREGNKDESSGIGMKNILRRLELLYPKRFKLETTQEDNQYKVSLELNL